MSATVVWEWERVGQERGELPTSLWGQLLGPLHHFGSLSPPGSLPSEGHSDRAEAARLEGRARDPVTLQPLAGSGQLPELLRAPAAAPGQGHAL